MKKLLILIGFIIFAQLSYSQALRPRSTGSFTEVDKRIKAEWNLIIPKGPTPSLNSGLSEGGQLFFNTTDNKLYVYNGSSWNIVSSDVDLSPYYKLHLL